MLSSILLILFEIVLFIIGYRAKNGWLQLLIIMNMAFIPLLGARMVDFFGLVSNLGNIFYAFVIFGFALLVLRDGKRIAHDTILKVLAANAFIFITMFLLAG
jgi:uncharacterized PurR-regulated membrane protein YhhQ (DUF165 family)